MGKSTSLLEPVKGKVGNVIGSINPNTDNKLRQVVRAYSSKVANPYNPRTEAQAFQRAKLLPINMHYRAFKSLIERGFENVKYGYMSRNKYLSIVLRNLDAYRDLAPVLKGDSGYQPSQLLISKGTLRPLTTDYEVQDDNYDDEPWHDDITGKDYYFGYGINIKEIPGTESQSSPATTIGQFSELLINAGLAKEGDQLTACLVSAKIDGLDLFIPSYISMNLNTADQNPLPDNGFIKLGCFKNWNGASDNFNKWYTGVAFSNHDRTNTHPEYLVLGGCFSISRDGDTPKRSKAAIALNPKFTYDLYTKENWDVNVIPSYMREGSASVSDWPLDTEPMADLNLPEGYTAITKKLLTGEDIEDNSVSEAQFTPSHLLIATKPNGEQAIFQTQVTQQQYALVGANGHYIQFAWKDADHPTGTEGFLQESQLEEDIYSNVHVLNWDPNYSHF